MNTASSTPTRTLSRHLGSVASKQATSVSTVKRRQIASGKKSTDNFDRTMHEITRDMPTHQRLFSRLIHSSAISSLSDAMGGTLARPTALLAGAVLSFAITLTVYLLAKNLGYTLSGFETIGAFILGWLLGLTYDFLKLMISGKP